MFNYAVNGHISNRSQSIEDIIYSTEKNADRNSQSAQYTSIDVDSSTGVCVCVCVYLLFIDVSIELYAWKWFSLSVIAHFLRQCPMQYERISQFTQLISVAYTAFAILSIAWLM